jgi:hypothetical protein
MMPLQWRFWLVETGFGLADSLRVSCGLVHTLLELVMH